MSAKFTLQGRGVIVTRAQHQADELCRLLSEAGAIPIRFPTLAIEAPQDITAARKIIAELDTFDMAIFISANAVARALDLITEISGALPAGLKLAVVGKATAGALMSAGYSADLMPVSEFTSEGLLALPQLHDVGGRRIVIFRGEDGRGTLAEVLRGRGAEVVYAEVYRRTVPDIDAGGLLQRWRRGEIHAATVTSNETLQNLFDKVGNEGQGWLRQTPLVVLSARARDLAQELGFRREIIIARTPDDAAIIAALQTVIGEPG